MNGDRTIVLALSMLGLAAVACGGEDLGDAPQGAAGGGAVEPTFARVTQITTTSCALPGCHAAGGLHINLSSTGLRTRLLGPPPETAAELCRGRTLVVPGMPDASLIVHKIEADDAARAGCGTRMPNGCAAMPTPQRPCLVDDDIQSIRGWIEAGAPE